MKDQEMINAEADWYSPQSATFGDRLAGAREAAHLSQAELARRLGVRLNTLKAWENDLSEPRANRLSMLAGLLNVSIGWLLMGEGQGIAQSVERDDTESLSDLVLELRQLRAETEAIARRMAQIEARLVSRAGQ